MNKFLPALALSLGLAFSASAQAERLTDQPLVDSAWLKQHLGNPSLVVLDLRDSTADNNFYAKGHIPGAVHAPYAGAGWRTDLDGVPGMMPPADQITALIGNLGITNDTHVVVVPQGTSSSDFGSATRVYWSFKYLGHDEVSILDGGYQAWNASGGELSTTAPTPKAGSFTAEIRPELLATTAQVTAALNSDIALVDGRPAPQYKGEAKSPVVRAPGTIPGAVNIDNAQFYDAPNASFVSADRVAELARGVGLGAEEPAIAFCNTGHWASVIWFGLSEVQGNKKVSMYDGSMAEWAADPSRPIQ